MILLLNIWSATHCNSKTIQWFYSSKWCFSDLFYKLMWRDTLNQNGRYERNSWNKKCSRRNAENGWRWDAKFKLQLVFRIFFPFSHLLPLFNHSSAPPRICEWYGLPNPLFYLNELINPTRQKSSKINHFNQSIIFYCNINIVKYYVQ